MHNQKIYDVTIIGGGPAGLYTAFYSGLRGMKTKIIEYQDRLGGKLHVYPEKMVWDVGGVPPVPGAVLIDQLVTQGMTFSPTVCLETKIESISHTDKGLFVLETAAGEKHFSRTVIVAVGGGILNPKRLLVGGAERFEHTNLHYAVESLQRFKDKTVIISGGGNSAIDWAHELEGIAKQVFITCRNDSFKCHESQADQLHQSSVVCFFHTSITGFISASEKYIEKVELTNTVSGHVEYLSVDEVIVNHGYERETSLLDNSDIEIERKEDYFIASNSQGESSIPGLYAVGDILMHEGKLNLIAGAFHDAANAVNLAKQWLDPTAAKGAMVSSHNDLFKDKNREIIKKMVK